MPQDQPQCLLTLLDVSDSSIFGRIFLDTGIHETDKSVVDYVEDRILFNCDSGQFPWHNGSRYSDSGAQDLLLVA